MMLWAWLEFTRARARARARRAARDFLAPATLARPRCACTRCAADRAFRAVA